MRWWLELPLSSIVELWNSVWGVLGPAIVTAIILYFRHPEKFEKIIVHVTHFLSLFSGEFEKKAIAREVSYIVSSEFAKSYRIEEVPKVVVEWGEEDKALLDLERNLLLIVLRRGRKYRNENVARALLKAIPELLAPEVRAVYSPKLVDCLSAHVARSLASDRLPIVAAINEFVASELEKDEEAREILTMLVEIDDQSLFSRVLLPELIEVAALRYPHRDPQIDNEALNLIKTLHGIVRGAASNPLVCGKYFNALFVRVARPEKVEALLEPHVKFVERSLNECRALKRIYILAAGKANIAAAKLLRARLERELERRGLALEASEQAYAGRYREKPHMELYVCRISIKPSR